jgi:hypothetical protein
MSAKVVQRIAFSALLVLMFGVATGWISGG